MSDYYTFEGYERLRKGEMSKSMEDYLEMICRLAEEDPAVRMQQLAEALNVNSSSATRMAKQLGDMGYIQYKPYGYIKLTEKGKKAGDYLLYRHSVLHEFLKFINNSQDELEQVELIEHHINKETVLNIEKLIKKLKNS